MNLTADDLDYLRTILPGPGKVKDAHRAAYTRLMRAALDVGATAAEAPAVETGPMGDVQYVATLPADALVRLRVRGGSTLVHKIDIIKIVRSKAGWDLRTAKDAVEGSGLTFPVERDHALGILSQVWDLPFGARITGAQVFEVVR